MVRFVAAFHLLVLIGFLSSRSESLRFDLQSGHTKCISEDIKQNAMTVGKYHVVNPNEGQPLTDERKLIVRVTSATGNTYHYSDKVESGQFGFVAAEAGDFMACFWAPDHQPIVTLSVDFDWRTGVAAKDWSNVAKKGSVEDFDWRVYPKLEFFEKLRFQNSRKLGFFGCIGSIFLSCLSAFLFIEQPRVSLKFGNSKQSLTSFNDIVFVIS
uniref:GOLD domain-containing protein n=1 Tax=Cucumis sativus TaxID=3659 RepID=A0A0A0KTU9_CUCSA